MNTPLLGGDELVTSPSAQYDALRFVSEESPCPYLPGRLARSEVYRVDELLPHDYERLIGLGFRRCGRIVYRPQCRGCRECRQLRVRVADFELTRSMNRVWRTNRDVTVSSQTPSASNESYELFVRYLNNQHDGTMGRTRESFADFLYDSPTDSIEFHYRLGTRLIGVSIADRVPSGLSSVYMFFDPRFGSRSLGTFSILWEIDFVRREGGSHYYLGYYIADSATMAYKARFQPHDLLAGEQRWVSVSG